MRCTIQDAAINVFGPRLRAFWGPQEKQVGHGFAGVPTDNVGVQYGLGALRSGKINAAQFVDLNVKIGGLDADAAPVPNRMTADRPALANAYRSGMINEANNLDRTAIIDCRGPDEGALPRRLPGVRPAGAARPRARRPRQPADLGGADDHHRRTRSAS